MLTSLPSAQPASTPPAATDTLEQDDGPEAGSDGDGPSDADPGHQPAPGACVVDVLLQVDPGDDAAGPPLDSPLDAWLGEQLARIAALADVGNGTIVVAVVDDAAMARMHQHHLGAAGTTDVLTFDLRDTPADPLEGDIVVCIDEARRQAALRGHPARLELLLYAVHGLLHLLGHDDHDADAAERMHCREDELLTAAGFGPVFHHHRHDGQQADRPAHGD